MIRISNTDIYLLKEPGLDGIIRLRVPLPPSTNRRQKVGFKKLKGDNGGVGLHFRMPVVPIMILTKEAQSYIDSMLYPLRSLVSRFQIKPVNEFTEFKLWFVMKSHAYDNHNALKLLFDAFEYGHLVENDKFIMPHVCGVDYNPDDPHVIVEYKTIRPASV